MRRLILLIVLLIPLFVFKQPLVEFLRWLPVSSEWIGPVKGVTTGKDEATKEGTLYKEVIPAHKVKFQCSPEIFHVGAASVTVLSEARITQKYGLVIAKSDLLVADNANDWSVKNIEEVSLYKRLHIPSIQKYYKESIAVLATKGSECYYHWMFEVLLKIKLLEASGLKPDKFYIADIQQPFQKETLAHLGIGESQLIEANRHTMIIADTVIVPSRPGSTGWAQNVLEPWIISFLREKFLSPAGKESPQKIYISRNLARRRRVVNEEELIVLLKHYDFTVIELEKLSVKEQAALFSAAKIIVAPHGAALTNLVFVSPGAVVIEFYHPKHHVTCYEPIAEMMEVDHYSLLMEDAGGTLDGRVDLTEVENLLTSCLCHRQIL